MAIVDNPKSELPAQLKGLHLFGDGLAPCAQRVRFALGEKGFRRSPDIKWNSTRPDTLQAAEPHTYISRRVSLPRKQHLCAEYAALHPNMVVPALVHDGVLHIESVDIIEYLDETWPDNPLFPREHESRQLCDKYVQMAKELHRSVRYMSFKWSFGAMAKLDEKQLQLLNELEREASPENLLSFYDEFSHDRITQEVYMHHLRRLQSGFAELEQLFVSDQRPWIVGSAFSMADIIWAIKVLRIRDCGYPMARHFPALYAWFLRVRARPGFVEGVWRDARWASRAFRVKSAVTGLFSPNIREMSETLKQQQA